jgi:neutral ceramidase
MFCRRLAICCAVCLPLAGAGFRASAVKVDITPSTPQWLLGYDARQSTGAHDKIYHRVVAMDSGDTQFYLISTDICLYSPGLYDDVAAQLKKEMGIDPKNVWWSVTHSHSAPEIGPQGMYKVLLGRSDHEWNRDYAAFATKSLIDAVRGARDKLEPARIAIGEGMAMANINRRAKDVTGRVALGLNPDGPADRQIGLIRLEKPDGSLIAVIMNYAMHGTVLSGSNLSISGDAPGAVTVYLEQKLGGTVLWEQGAAGNLSPIYHGYPDARSGPLPFFEVLVGDKVLDALQRLGPATDTVTMSTAAMTIDTPRKDNLGWPDELSAYAGTEAGRTMVKLPVRFLRINDTFVWSLPVEMFCEIALNVRNHSPFPHTFYFGYTNGWFGYLPTAQAFQEGGYEPTTSPFTGQAEADVNRAVLGFIHTLPQPR